MKSFPQNNHSTSGGFALVVALSLMAFVLLLLLSITTLVQVEQASSRTSIQRVEADQAALLSLQIAIGKLQETAGLDQRVTAPAESVAGVADKSKHVKQLTGVWRSWEGSDHDSDGLPIPPSYEKKLQTQTGDQDIVAAGAAEGRFLNWLVSSAYDPDNVGTFTATNPPSLEKTQSGSDRTVPLVGSGSVVPDPDDPTVVASDLEVYLKPTPINDGEAAIAWWISGENTKALIKQDASLPEDSSEWSQRFASNGRADPEAFELTDDDQLGNVSSLNTLNLASSTSTTVSQENYYGLTTFSRGLLTNTANGGWRRDFSLMAEEWAAEWSNPSGGGVNANNISDFEPGNVFTLAPGVQQSTDLRIDASGPSASIYPWAADDITSMSWNALAEFVALYKRVQTNSNGMPYFDTYTHLGVDRLSIDPVMARSHWTFGFAAELQGANYYPMLAYKPSVTMWNPYNVAIQVTQSVEVAMGRFQDNHTYFPVDFTFEINDGGNIKEYTPTLGFLIGNQNAGVRNCRQLVELPTSPDLMWRPGESRVMGLDEDSFREFNNNAVAYLGPGVNTQGGYKRRLSHRAPGSNKPPASFFGSGDASYKVKWQLSTNPSSGDVEAFMRYRPNRGTANEGSGNPGKNFRIDMLTVSSLGDAEAAGMVPTIQNVDETLFSAATSESPFANVLFTHRVLADSKFPTKGYMNNKLIVSHTKAPLGDETFNQSSYEWVLLPSATWDGPGTPESDDTGAFGDEHSSYVGSNYESLNGIPGWSIAELPTQPLLSLGELQHFDAGYNNPIAPRVANAIGNSHATPDILSYEVTRSVTEGDGYDHSYIGNYLLFDDWFVSSVAPDTQPFSASIDRNIQEVYSAHLLGEEPLPNSAYLPAETFTDSGQASAAASTLLGDSNAWRDVASKLEVEGMFNINSTSVKAWEALLKSQREASTPHVAYGANLDTTPQNWSIELETIGAGDSARYPFSRTTVASEPDTDSFGGDLIAKRPQLTDLQIETLAEEIVEQVKLRGPFLSLSEFVNRQLSSNVDLALAGTIESALIEMSEMDDARDPFQQIELEFPQQAVAGSTAVFTEAAVGSVAYGTTGWVRQADILRPLAPILSARDDTFTIRAYGEIQNETTGEITASWCEAVVQRKAEYVDSAADDTTVLPSDSTLASETNKRFGRGFSVVSFRWLTPDEV